MLNIELLFEIIVVLLSPSFSGHAKALPRAGLIAVKQEWPAARALWRCFISHGLVGEADRVQGEYGMLLKDMEDKMRMEALTMIFNSSRDIFQEQPALGAHSGN